MEVLSISTIGIIALWVAGIIVIDNYRKGAWVRKLRGYQGRVVALSSEFRAKNKDVIGGAKYGTIIEDSQTDEKRQKVLEFVVEIMPTKEVFALAEGKYKEQFKQLKAQYLEQTQEYQKQIALLQDPSSVQFQQHRQNYMMGYDNSIPRRPQEPSYNFHYEPEEFCLKTKHLKLMPKGFDIVSVSIMKNINSKKGGEKKKKMGKMPRIFRFAIYSAVTVLIWDFVANVNQVAIFFVNLFLHK